MPVLWKGLLDVKFVPKSQREAFRKSNWLGSMFDNIDTQFHNQILRKFKNFRDLRLSGAMGDQKLPIAATDCAAALFHFREHIPAEHRLSRNGVSSRCPDYKLIADVTNAVKHGEITREPSDGPTLLNTSADIFELGIIINFDCEEEPYSHSEVVVCVDCTDGQRRCLDEAIVNVVNFWGHELERLGFRSFKSFEQLPFPGTTYIKRSEARSLQIGITQGLAYTSKWQFMKWDYEAGIARPVNLTGADVRFKMYRPKYSLDIKINIPSVEDEYVHTVELSDEDSRQYMSLQTEAEKEAFHIGLANERKTEIEEGLAAFIEQRSGNPNQ